MSAEHNSSDAQSTTQQRQQIRQEITNKKNLEPCSKESAAGAHLLTLQRYHSHRDGRGETTANDKHSSHRSSSPMISATSSPAFCLHEPTKQNDEINKTERKMIPGTSRASFGSSSTHPTALSHRTPCKTEMLVTQAGFLIFIWERVGCTLPSV